MKMSPDNLNEEMLCFSKLFFLKLSVMVFYCVYKVCGNNRHVKLLKVPNEVRAWMEDRWPGQMPPDTSTVFSPACLFICLIMWYL